LRLHQCITETIDAAGNKIVKKSRIEVV